VPEVSSKKGGSCQLDKKDPASGAHRVSEGPIVKEAVSDSAKTLLSMGGAGVPETSLTQYWKIYVAYREVQGSRHRAETQRPGAVAYTGSPKEV